MDAEKLFIVDTIVTYRHRYVIQAKELEHAYDEVCCRYNESFEVSEKYLGETIVDGREISATDYDNLLKSIRNDKDEVLAQRPIKKLIRVIDYKDV